MTEDEESEREARKERAAIARELALEGFNGVFVGSLDQIDIDLLSETAGANDVDYKHFALLRKYDRFDSDGDRIEAGDVAIKEDEDGHITTKMRVGDMILENDGNTVTVRRDGDVIGQITAQGLHEAADIGDDQLAGFWAALNDPDKDVMKGFGAMKDVDGFAEAVEENQLGRGGDEPSLEEALDGLIAASKYANKIAEDELAEQISMCYQKVGEAAPDEDWGVPDCVENNCGSTSGDSIQGFSRPGKEMPSPDHDPEELGKRGIQLRDEFADALAGTEFGDSVVLPLDAVQLLYDRNIQNIINCLRRNEVESIPALAEQLDMDIDLVTEKLNSLMKYDIISMSVSESKKQPRLKYRYVVFEPLHTETGVGELDGKEK